MVSGRVFRTQGCQSVDEKLVKVSGMGLLFIYFLFISFFLFVAILSTYRTVSNSVGRLISLADRET